MWVGHTTSTAGADDVTAVYLGAAAVSKLRVAQAEIDAHLHARAGSCARCRQVAPCPTLVRASALFARYGQLPRRRPGLALRGVVR